MQRYMHCLFAVALFCCCDGEPSCWCPFIQPFSLPPPLCVQSAAWVALIFIAVFFAVSIARLVILIRRRKEDKRRRQLVEYDIADDKPPAPIQ